MTQAAPVPPSRAEAARRFHGPYPGLRPFFQDDAPRFFGRGKQTSRMLECLEDRRFLAVVGASGCGKSSLVHAGLLPALERGYLMDALPHWRMVKLRPGDAPLQNLATALHKELHQAAADGNSTGAEGAATRTDLFGVPLTLNTFQRGRFGLLQAVADARLDDNTNVLVLVDQFEELFRYRDKAEQELRAGAAAQTQYARHNEAIAFVNLLITAAAQVEQPVYVVITMRSDFLGNCDLFQGLPEAINQSQFLTPRMTRDQLREAIVGPLEMFRADADPALVDRILNEIGPEPDQLPLMQHALMRTWSVACQPPDAWQKTPIRLTVEHYTNASVGGVAKSLNIQADEVYRGLAAMTPGPLREDPPQSESQRICGRMFRCLSDVNESGQVVRRLATVQEIADVARVTPEKTLEVAQPFLAEDCSFLLISERGTTLDETTLDISHEALLRQWELAQQWLKEEEDDARQYRRLLESACLHDQRSGNLLIGLERRVQSRWWETRKPTEAWAARYGGSLSVVKKFIADSRKASIQKLLLLIAGVLALAVGSFFWWNDKNRLRAVGFVEKLDSAEIGEVTAIVPQIERYRRWADGLLQERFRGSTVEPRVRLHAAIALLPVDNAPIEYLRQQLLQVTRDQFPVVRNALRPHLKKILERLWEAALTMEPNSRESFQAACALATYAPKDERWTQISAAVADHLMTLETSEQGAWRTALKPASEQLLEPLATIYRNKAAKEQSRTYAAETLADYAAKDAETLFELLADAEQFQFPTIYNKLADHRDRIVAMGQAELQKRAADGANEEARETLGRRQANVAVALLKLGAAEHVWNLLRHSPDPRARSYVIDWLSPLGGDPQMILRRFEDEKDVSIRRALLLALGGFTGAQFPPADRAPVIDELLALYAKDHDPGLHAAAEWLLRQWGQAEKIHAAVNKMHENEVQLRSRRPGDKRQWYVNSEGQTFVILEVGDFRMGSPLSEPDREPDETPHLRRIGRTLAIAAKEVTREEYSRFLDANPGVQRPKFDQYSPTDDSPQVGLDWYDAARYCNWLSKIEGLREDRWCYEANKEDEFGEGMRPAADFLKRTGYRLPTEAEWEFACRADAVTGRYYGASVALLRRYAWFVENSLGFFARPIGGLKPNDFGLFDALGNALEWCHDAYGDYPITDAGGVVNDDGDKSTVDDEQNRVLRGASFAYPASSVRSTNRTKNRPDYRYIFTGVRPARTYR